MIRTRIKTKDQKEELEPTEEEIVSNLKNFLNVKSPKYNAIPAEIVKYGGRQLTHIIRKLIKTIVKMGLMWHLWPKVKQI